MKFIAALLLAALPALSIADPFAKDTVYKCVKDSRITYQEMPCGWSTLGKDAHKGEQQFLIPFTDFCKDKSISDQTSLKKTCPHFDLPKQAD